MSWKRRHAIAEKEANRWWREVLRADKTIFDLECEAINLERDKEQLTELLWRTVAEANAGRDMRAQVVHLRDAVELADESGYAMNMSTIALMLNEILGEDK